MHTHTHTRTHSNTETLSPSRPVQHCTTTQSTGGLTMFLCRASHTKTEVFNPHARQRPQLHWLTGTPNAKQLEQPCRSINSHTLSRPALAMLCGYFVVQVVKELDSKSKCPGSNPGRYNPQTQSSSFSIFLPLAVDEQHNILVQHADNQQVHIKQFLYQYTKQGHTQAVASQGAKLHYKLGQSITLI